MPDRPHRRRVVIVGSGAAGPFCARALADVADVVLIEAGDDAGWPQPAWMRADLATPDSVDWHLLDAGTGKPVLRGRVTGGSTSTNSAAALRGQPWCFDGWNVPGWTWRDVVRGFAAIETDLQFGDREGHGATGPVPITRQTFGPIDSRFARWAMREGHAWVDDQNAAGALGVGPWPTNRVDDSIRWGTHAAVLPLVRGRIELRSGTEARRLVFEGDRCVGVDVTCASGGDAFVPADHVVLAAGSVGSPALLLRSGIGPRADLDAAGIPVVLDRNAVGADLQDHPWTVLQVRSTDAAAPGIRPVNGALLRYEVDPVDRVEVHLYPHQAKPYLPGADDADVLVGIGLMRAVSRGSVRLSANGEPEVRRNLLADPADAAAFRAVLADAARYIDDMVADAVFVAPVDPWWRSADLDAAIAERLDSYGHLVGTCRMGTDAAAVVDPDCSVVGIEGLSVADASIMPTGPRANTMLTTMMIGHRAGALIADRLHDATAPRSSADTAPIRRPKDEDRA